MPEKPSKENHGSYLDFRVAGRTYGMESNRPEYVRSIPSLPIMFGHLPSGLYLESTRTIIIGTTVQTGRMAG